MPEISYTIKKSERAKRLSLKVERSGQVVVILPKRYPARLIDPFVQSNQAWIARQQQALSKLTRITPQNLGPNSHAKHLLAAKKNLSIKAKLWSQKLGLEYKSLTVKNQISRWGSCSRAGNLNFSYKLNLIDEALLDYVVVHELCHLKEMNHGPNFWKLVGQAIPDYQLRRHKLKNIIIQ